MTRPIDWDDVTGFAPDVVVDDEDAQDTILDYVNSVFDVSLLGGETSTVVRLARILMAAHMGSSSGAGAVGGTITAESCGGLARSYGTAPPTSALNGASRYGTELAVLLRRKAGGPRTVW